MASSDIGAFAAAFGDAFSQTHNRRIQQQMAEKAQKRLMIADELVKGTFEGTVDPNDPDVAKFMGAILGKNEAQAISAVAAAFNNSPMGILRRSFGADVDVPQGVSMGADGPGTGPSMAPQDILATGSTQQKEQLRDTIRERMAGKSALETGLGYGQGQGQLRAQDIKAETALTPKPMSEKDRDASARGWAEYDRKVKRDAALVEKYTKELEFKKQQGEINTDLKRKQVEIQRERLAWSKENAARQQRNADREFGLKQIGENRRGKFAQWSMAKGSVENDVVTLPTGDQVPVRVRRFSPDGGKTIQEQIVSMKLEKTPEAPRDKIASINGALRYEDDLERIFNENRDSIAQVFAPFAGRTLSQLQNNLGALTPIQQNFVQLLSELRASRSFINGGKALTNTELALIDGTLPNVNVMAEAFLPMLQKSREILTALGADTENSLNESGYIAPRTRTSTSNVDYYNRLRKRPADLTKRKPVTVWTAPPDEELDDAPPSSGDPEADAVNAAFMGQ